MNFNHSKNVLMSGLICLVLFLLIGCERDTVIDAREHKNYQRLSELRILSWSDYIAPEVIKDFEEQFGKKVIVKEYENTAEMISICEAENHKFDIVIGPSYVMAQLHRKARLAKIDTEKLRGEELIQPKFRYHPWDLGAEYSIPYFSGSTIVAYRSDKIQPAEESFELLFEDIVKGKTAILSDHPERFALAHLLRGVEVDNLKTPELEASSKVLEFYQRQCKGRFLNDRAIREGLLSGDLWAAHCYNRDSAKLAQANPTIKYFTPKEGAVLWLDVLGIAAESRNPETAYRFFNFLLQPTVTAQNANFVCQVPPNMLAIELMDKELTSDPNIFLNQSVLQRCSFLATPNDRANRVMSELSRKVFDIADGESDR